MILIVTMSISIGMTVSAMEYPDDGYWANEAIDAAIANGLLRGKGNGNIESEANLTRAEMAAIMVRSFGASVRADVSQYVDLDPSAWYYDEFAKAVQMRVFEGDGTGYMRPNDNITREEVFTVVARAMVLSNSDHSALNKFGDANQISSWARDYMSILTQKAYVNGDNLGNVNPQAYITRAEFAQLMHNIFKKYYSNVGTYENLDEVANVMINTEGVTLKNVTIEGDLVIGDGANLSTIVLENVNIKGRLVVRGSAKIRIVKSTVGENVVVNNYNSVVHFDNYRNEKVFDGIILNTKATFKQRGGGSSSSSIISYVITFDVDGGTPIPDSIAYYGEGFVLPGNDSTTKYGWYLKGWNVNGTIYEPGATVTGITSNTTIMAVWEKYGIYLIKYYVQNDAGGYDYIATDDEDDFAKAGSFTITVNPNKYGDDYVLSSSNIYTKDIVSGQTTTFDIYYDIKTDGDEYVTVTFINNGIVVGTVELKSGNSMADENKIFPDASWSKDGYVKDTNISQIYTGDKENTHTINWAWWYNPTSLKWEQFTENTKVDSDVEVSLRVKKFSAWVYADLKPDGFPFTAYYEGDTRFADTIKDILYFDAPLEALKMTGYWDTVREKLVGFELLNSIDPDDNILMQNIPIKFVQVIGEDKLEDYIVDSAKEMFGGKENKALTDAFVTYLENSYNSENEENVKEITNLMVNTIDHILDTNPSTIEDLCRDILKDKAAFKEITGYDYDLLPTDVREFAVDYIAKELSTNDELLKEVVLAYSGKEYDGLSEDPKKLVVELTGGALDNADTLEELVESMAGVKVEITDNMNVKQLLVKVAETKLETDETFLEEAIKEILGEGITVSIKDENDNYKSIQNYLAEIAVAKLGTPENSTLFGDVVFKYLNTNISTENKNIREFFVEVAKEDLSKTDSKLLKSFIKKFVGYDVAIDDNTTTKDFFVDAIMTMLENEPEFFSTTTKAVFGVDYNSLDANAQDDARTFISVVIENKLNTDADFYNDALNVVFGTEAFPDNTTGVVLAFVTYRLMTDDTYFDSVLGVVPSDEADREAAVKSYILSIKSTDDYYSLKGFNIDDYSSNPDEAFVQLVRDELQFNDTAFEKLTGYSVADVAGKTGKEFIIEKAEEKLNDDDTYLSDLVRDEIGYEYDTLPSKAREMIVYVADDKFTKASEDELNSAIEMLGYGFTIDNWSGDAKDEILKVVEKELMSDSVELEDAMTKVGIDVTIKDWTVDAKTVIIEKAKLALNNEDNDYLNKVVTKLNIPESITDDWSKDAKAAVKDYAEDKLDTDKEFFKKITGYYPSELEGKTKKEVLISIVRTQLAENDKLFETATGWNVDDLPDTAADFMIETVLRELRDPESTVRYQVEEKAVDYLLNHHDDLVKAADLAMGYLNDHPDERDEIIDKIIEEVYRDYLDELIRQLKEEDQFEITADTLFIAEGLKSKIEEDYNYETLIGSRVPEKVFEIYPEEKLKDIYNEAYNDFIKQINDAMEDAKTGKTGLIDTGVTIRFNPVDDFYTPLYDRLLEFVKEKGEDKKYYFYYEDNEYLQEFIRLLSTESLFEGSIDGENKTISGYKLRSIDEYYNLVKSLVFLADDAILWYYKSELADDIEKVIDSYQKLILKYVNATVDVANRYAEDGTLPNQKLSPIESAFKKRYPKIVDEILTKYKDSDINKDYGDEDFQKVQDKVRNAFEYVNITTDEYFDKILGFEKLHDVEKLDKYFEKISDDEYKFEVKGNIMKFLREVVDA